MAEGDGEQVYRCWRLLLPNFKAADRTKYSLRLQFQACLYNLLITLFGIGGPGRNIPCNLYNEHIVKLISSMGTNLTEKALQRAARSITTLHHVCTQFDKESLVPITTSAHSTRSDTPDVKKVVNAVLHNDLLTIVDGRSHRSYRTMRLTPLWNWNKRKTIEWIDKKKKDVKCRRMTMDENEEEIEESDSESVVSTD